MKRTVSLFGLIIITVLLCGPAISEDQHFIVDYTEPTVRYSLELAVPFGITHAGEQSSVPLYYSPDQEVLFSIIPDRQLCEIYEATAAGDSVWFYVLYYDTEGNALKGYIKGTDFYQLTIAGLIRITADPAIAGYMQQYISNKDYTMAFLNTTETTARSSPITDAAYQIDLVIDEDRNSYIVNKNTKKFHLPSCSSVNDMKSKNLERRKTTRDELIKEGFIPCKICNP